MSDIKLTRYQAKIIAWLVLFYASAVFPAVAQDYFFDNYGIKQGLSEQKVYTLLQDSKDYIWLGTANGLSRFDGKKFENFTSRDSLSQSGVRSIFEDSNGDIWFGHLYGGITRYNGTIFEKVAFDSIFLKGDITAITQTGDKIWFASAGDGALRADFPVNDIKKISVRQFKGKEGLSDQIFGATINNDSSLIYVADYGMRRYNKEEDKFDNYRMPHMTTYFNATCLKEDKKGNIWFGTYNGGVYKYIMSESRMEVIDLIRAGSASNWVSCFEEDRHGRMWVGTFDGGVVLFDNDKIKVFNEKNGFIPTRIYDIIEDVEGNILIADQNNGLTIYKGDAFVTFNKKELLPHPSVNAIYEDKGGAVWFGTIDGISRFLPESTRPPVIYDEKNNLIFKDIRFFREDLEGNLWIGANAGGVMMFNMKTSKFESQPEINSTLYTGGQVKALEIDRKNNLWIGTVDGVTVGTIGQQNFRRYNYLDSLIIKTITCLYCDLNGDMWIGTESMGGRAGLMKYTSKKDLFQRVSTLTGTIPKALVMDKKGILWIGTSEGLIGYRNDSILITVTQNNGLLSNNINLLAAGDDGSIFIGTNSGLNRYIPETQQIFSYTERNGFPGIETKQHAVFKSGKGALWFGTANGATRLNPEKTSTESLEPLTHIMSMRVNYEPREMEAGMKLSSNEKSVLFNYYSICLTNPEVVRYKVKLQGADDDWRPVTDQTQAIYSGLSPGRYTFMVLANNSQGIWNKAPVTFSFTIKPPFYLTWWFILISVILILVIIVAYIKIREQNLIKEKMILEEKVRERTAEVVQKSLIIEEKNRDITASIRYAERIQRAMLPKEEAFRDTFVLFLPKDIVSGDFYWMHDNGDWLFFAAVDCTGHGVPGAFMSIIGHNSLSKVVREYGLTRPAAILDQLNIEVMKALLQRHEKAIMDGMDLALIAIERKTGKVEYAGAYNPLYLVRKGEVITYKGDRFPIGMTTMEEKKSFTNQLVDVQPGDMLYMCSDGYADQFGSEEVKKYKSNNVKKLLSEIWSLPVIEQKARLEKEIMTWKGDLEQVDDILFIGTKIPED